MCAIQQMPNCLGGTRKTYKIITAAKKKRQKRDEKKKKRATSHVEIVSDRVRNESAGRGRESGATIVPKGKLMTV